MMADRSYERVASTVKPCLDKARRSDKVICVIAAIILVLIVCAGCSLLSDDSDELIEYIAGKIQYGRNGNPEKVAFRSENFPNYVNLEMDNTKSTESEDEDSFVLKLLNHSGRTLRSINFYAKPSIIHADPTLEALSKNPNMRTEFKFANFEIALKNFSDYTSIVVMHEGSELTVEELTDNSPVISVSGPEKDRVFSGGDFIHISWDASDVDGDRLNHQIYYSVNGGRRYSRFSKWNETSPKRISATSLASSAKSRLAVLVSDGARSAFAETEIFTIAEHVPVETTVISVYLPPRAYDDASNGYVGETFRIYVLNNDIYSARDFDLNSLKIDIPPSSGVAYVNDARKPFIEYIPTSVGADTLTYSICNKDGQCDSAQVTITSIVNQPPVANDDIAGGDIGEVLRIDVLANDIYTEKDFNYESLRIDAPPIFGTASVKVKREFIAEGNSEDLIGHNSGDTQAVSSLTLRPLTLKQADIWSLQNIDTPPTLPSILKYFIEYHYAFTAIDSLTYSICDTFDQCDTAEVTIKAGTADCTILGTEDDDTLRGTPGDDVICGLAGDDTIHAGEGDDIIKAGLGDDVVFAETGDDTIYGEAGDDTIDSGTGDDIVRGSDGNDRITGGDGADELYGGPGDDTLDGGAGNDIIHGSKGDDTIYGGSGDDSIRGNLGADTIYPGEGNDTLEGSTEQDTIIR